jgi:preprotein translocase subunit SecF
MKQIIDIIVSVVAVLIVWGLLWLMGLEVGRGSEQLMSTLTVGQFVGYLYSWSVHAWVAWFIITGYKKSDGH